MRQLNKDQTGFTHILTLIVLALVISSVAYISYVRVKDNNQIVTPAIVKKVGLVRNVNFSKTVDTTGKAISPTSVLSATDTRVNVVSTLNDVVKGTKIEYTRYLDNKFVDNGSLTINKDGAKYANFTFTSNATKQFKSGDYKVKIYANGKYQTSGNYTIQ